MDRSVAEEIVLETNYPNPFNPTTTILFTLPQQQGVRLEVFDVLGRRIKILMDGVKGPGRHRVTWDGTDAGGANVTGGVYLYTLQAGSFSSMRKMLVLK
jgi:flagellar hook assembly protein FlgD